jgi:hypothetical protein
MVPPVIEPPVAVKDEVESMEIEVVIDPSRPGLTAPSWMLSVVPLETATESNGTMIVNTPPSSRVMVWARAPRAAKTVRTASRHRADCRLVRMAPPPLAARRERCASRRTVAPRAPRRNHRYGLLTLPQIDIER